MCAWGDLGTSWPVVVWYLQGLLTPLVAFIAVYIAYQQWRTNALKSKLDLFDRRCRVLEAIRTRLSVAFGKGDLSRDDLQKFMSEGRMAEFLFRSEIKGYIGEIYSRGLSLSTVNEELREIFEGMDSPTRRQALAVKIQAEVEWFTQQLPISGDKFKKYLDVSKL